MLQYTRHLAARGAYDVPFPQYNEAEALWSGSVGNLRPPIDLGHNWEYSPDLARKNLILFTSIVSLSEIWLGAIPKSP